ncbi:FAD-binding protein [Sinomonas atrocyanea]|uniref:FAD-binding protein n=1 Tax=Sinomonas atrocyanea TaxID=37927 RepID=UPI002784EF74|nr:FAD-binding protein [Sinomonas atrocyanea]MDQ0260629.1 glycine/D-amino acid oxidase-like deaminating enzyme [Sinomonas atrocyanea]MDR6621366.1 glycine/D-amino acid oxidase-like deaminating enzyme [Sinomonas atrocyanea]
MPKPSRSEDAPSPQAGALQDEDPCSESTSAIVIGTGLSGLAVAAELARHAVAAVTVDGLESSAPTTATCALRVADLSSAESMEYLEVLRHLRKHAVSHGLDVRHHLTARHLALVEAQEPGAPARWAVRTDTGVLYADAVVLTRCAHNQLRRFLADLGYSLGEHLLEALGQIGLYLVGVTGLAAPSTREVLLQAKHVGAEVSAQVGAGLQPA